VCVDVLETFVLIILDELNKRANATSLYNERKWCRGLYIILKGERETIIFLYLDSLVASSSIDMKFMSVAINCISGGREQR
jgi:hypothetical protein